MLRYATVPLTRGLTQLSKFTFCSSKNLSAFKITYHAHRTWFDEDPSKGSEDIVVQIF